MITSMIVSLALASAVAARTFTVTNNCNYTVWPAIFTGVGSAVPNQTTGWEQDSFSSVSFTVPDIWQAGRIWGRRDCDFSTGASGPSSCLDGGCNGGLVCDPTTGTGAPPVTIAEFTLGTGADFYDGKLSLVDGFNIPIKIDNDKACPVPGCPVDLNPNCPAELVGPLDSTGAIVGCLSACAAGLGDPGECLPPAVNGELLLTLESHFSVNNPNCCTGTHNTPATCPSFGVQDYAYFKQNCPNSLVYAYDSVEDPLGCVGNLPDEYTITFCPS